MPAGVLKKMSLAVLLDQEVTWERDKNSFKRVLVPPPPEKLKVIRDLVAGITGFSADRGDQLVIETLPFETTLLLEPPGSTSPAGPAKPIPTGMAFKLDQKTLLMGGGAIAALIVLGFTAAMFLRRKRNNGSVEMSAQAALLAASGGQAAVGTLAAGGHVDKQIESQLAERDALQQKMDAQVLSSLKLAPVITKKAEVLAKHLREKIGKEADVSAQILRTWIRDEEN
jgi:flagellar biosynthesis/type III secretory pathway M-ring protein FliF/YscJ